MMNPRAQWEQLHSPFLTLPLFVFRDRRLSLTMMNCIWARNTDVETLDPVAGEVVQGREE